ncbi:MAG TPA: ABC transporter ATP-binding protein, partial [Bacillota bacterium]|nr:ABC transporter ATP-binding protein [Bacillota bacterium]
ALMLLHDPELILLDEPTLGLDVVAKRHTIGFLKDLNHLRGTTVLVTSHDMDDLEEMAKRIMLISSGKLAFDGSFSQLRQHTGNVCRITLTADSYAPELGLGRLVSSGSGLSEYEVNTAETSMQDVLGRIATLAGVTDIEIRRAPIEQIIARLYTEWRNESHSVD